MLLLLLKTGITESPVAGVKCGLSIICQLHLIPFADDFNYWYSGNLKHILLSLTGICCHPVSEKHRCFCLHGSIVLPGRIHLNQLYSLRVSGALHLPSV